MDKEERHGVVTSGGHGSRGIYFRGDIDPANLGDVEYMGGGRRPQSPNLRLSHTGSIRVRSPVAQMKQRKQSASPDHQTLLQILWIWISVNIELVSTAGAKSQMYGLGATVSVIRLVLTRHVMSSC
jgi:hypothetical protein